MATAFPVKYCHSAMRGAPEITAQPGTLLAVLRAFLMTGFGSATAQSVTVDNGVATAIMGSGNSFEEYSVVQITGADDAALNGEARIATATASTITWATNAADGDKTGTIHIRYAPVGGWEEPFTGTPEKAVFRSTEPESARHCLRIDDSAIKWAAVRGYESMSDLDNGSGSFPAAQHNVAAWLKSSASDNKPVRWDLVADSRMILLAIAPSSHSGSSSIAAIVRGFGEAVTLSPSGDPWLSLLCCSYTDSGSYHYGGLCQSYNSSDSSTGGTQCCRAYTGLGGAIVVRHRPLVGGNSISGDDDFLGPFPSIIDGQLKYSRKIITTAHNDNTARALLPGLLHIPQKNVMTSISARSRMQGEGEMAGRQLLALPVSDSSSSPRGIQLIDITGPWR